MYHELGEVKPNLNFPSKNNLTEPRPITSKKVQYALGDQEDLCNLQVTPKDERLLEIMIDRGEAEKAYWRKKLENAITWEKERLEIDITRREKAREHQARTIHTRESDKQLLQETKKDKESYYKEKRRYFEQEHQRLLEKARQAAEREKKLKEEKIKQMKEKDRKNREQQEKNWWEVHQTEHSRKYHEAQHNETKRKKALQTKREILLDEAFRIAFENKDTRENFQQRQAELDKETREDLEMMIKDLDERHSAARQNYDEYILQRNKELNIKSGRREKKHKEVEKVKEQIVYQNMSHMRGLLKSSQQKEKKAKKKIKKKLGDVVKKTKEQRENKAEQAKEMVQRLNEEEEGWKTSIMKSIAQREQQMLATQQQRRENLDQTRKIALDSRLLRMKIRDRYGQENFDKKLSQVQSFHQLGKKVVPPSWNESLISML